MKAKAKVVSLLLSVIFPLQNVGAVEGGDIERLVTELSAEAFQVREAASLELWEIGVEALAPLREAARSDDPERALRAAEILEKVELRITPETSGRILSLIRSYREAPDNQKGNFLNELKRLKAYYQVLKLYSLEGPETKRELASNVRGVAISGARQAVVRGETDTAIELLRLSTGEHSDLMALACLYRGLGQLEEQLMNPRPPENVPTDLWKLALLRSKGDVEGALELAAKSKQTRLLAALKVLSGDPVLWLQQNGLGRTGQQAQDSYVEIALKRWKGEPVADRDYAPLLKLLESRDEEERAHAMTSLASLGKLEALEKFQAKQSPTAGFVYYLAQENVVEALKAIGLDPEDPDYTGWAAKRFERLNGEDPDERREDDAASPELVMLAGFLERRGLNEELSSAFTEPFAEYAKQDIDDFLDLLGTLFEGTYGAPGFAADQAEKWAGEDEGRWSQVFSAALGDEEEVMEWLNWVREIKPDIAHREALDVLLALFQKSVTPGNLRSVWMDKAWEVTGETEDEDLRKKYVKRILSLAVNQQDVSNALKAWDMLGAEEQSSSMWNSIDKYLSAAGRWKEAAEILEGAGNNKESSSPEVHAYLAVNLRRAGMEERARIHDEWADKLALGYSPSCLRIGAYYLYGGDNERAAEWFRRAVVQADVSDGEFIAVLDDFADSMLRAGNWQVAASCYEALVQVYASQEYVNGALSGFAKERLGADLAKAMAVLPEDRERAVGILKAIHRNFETDGVLADDFFPLLRKAGLQDELEAWFDASWKRIAAVIEKYPESHNTRNTAAWFASRAGLELGQAEKFLSEALELAPDQPAYLDTMAEVNFAQGDRNAALKWSDRAVRLSPFDDMIRMQNDRFRKGKLPHQ